MIKKIQGGNTIHIRWTITKNRNTSLDNLSVKLFDVFRKDCVINYEIEEQDDKTILVKIVYEGKDQKSFGKYSLVLFNNYGEDNQNTLIFKDCFILLHALNNKLESWNDEYADNAVLVEIDSDLSIALMNQDIQDKDDIIEQISELSDTISDMQDQIDNISISDDVIEELENRFDSSFIALNSSIDVLNTSIDSLIETLDVSFNNIVDEIEKSERVLVEYFTVIDNSVNMLMNSSTQDFDDTELRTMISNTDTSIIDVSTRLKDLSTYTHNLELPEEYDDTELSNKVNDVSTRLKDLSTYTHNLVIPEEYDDSELRDLITSSNSSISNISTKLNNVSIIVDNLVSTGYDDTVIKNRIADVSQYAINLSTRVNDAYQYAQYAVEKDSLNTALIIHIDSSLLDISTKLNDLSTYTHNLNIPEEYDDSELSNKVNDVSTKLNDLSTYTHNLTPGSGDVDLTDVNSSISDLSTRMMAIENSSNITDWTDSFYYTPVYIIKKMINQGYANTSLLDFKDFMMCVSSGVVNSSGVCDADRSWPSGKTISLNSVLDNTLTGSISRKTFGGSRYGEVIINPITSDQTSAYYTKFYKLDSDSINSNSAPKGKWFAYHFPNKMRITNIDPSISDYYIFFRLEN